MTFDMIMNRSTYIQNDQKKHVRAAVFVKLRITLDD